MRATRDGGFTRDRQQVATAEWAARLLHSCLPLLCALLLAQSAAAVSEGEPAPQFRAPALDGGDAVSLSEHRGKVVLLDFWASWCPPCLKSLPQFERLKAAFSTDDFQIVAVNVDSDPDNARRFLRKTPISYRSASDLKGDLPRLYALQTMPTSYLIDRSGVVRYVHTGFSQGDIDELHERIKRLIRSGR